MLAACFVQEVTRTLKEQNRAFEVVRVEAPTLTPRSLVHASYTEQDLYVLDDLVLRPETTMGSFAAARALLDPHARRRFKLPLCVWQHGRSYRREQDQPLKHMRLKEFHQLELQILFAANTANDYSVAVVPAVARALATVLEVAIGTDRCVHNFTRRLEP